MIKDKVLLKLIKITRRRFNEKLKEKLSTELEIANAKKLVIAINDHIKKEGQFVDSNHFARITWEDFLSYSLDRVNLIQCHEAQQTDKLKIIEEELLELYTEEKKFQTLKENQDELMLKKKEAEEQSATDELNILSRNKDLSQ